MPRHSFVLALAVALAWSGHLWGQGFTVELDLRGQTFQGTPLAWSSDEATLLARDGRLLNFPAAQATNFRKVADTFHSYSQAEMRAQLAAEFGRGFDVSGTGHYLVVHPAGQRDTWARRFEDLYRSFTHYFTARGLAPHQPAFPLVAIVFPRQEDFLRYAADTTPRLQPGTLGYYSPTTNRILLYDVTGGQTGDDENWHINAETIIHEATHQSAFNSGIHNRYAMPPRWVAEGLGTLFEAPGVWNSRYFTRQRDRINEDRLLAFKRYAATRRPTGSLADFLSSDRLFKADVDGAYAEAWALTFFLTETRPRQYTEYLSRTASRERFRDYRSPERLHDFLSVFGPDLQLLEAHFLRYMNGVN